MIRRKKATQPLLVLTLAFQMKMMNISTVVCFSWLSLVVVVVVVVV